MIPQRKYTGGSVETSGSRTSCLPESHWNFYWPWWAGVVRNWNKYILNVYFLTCRLKSSAIRKETLTPSSPKDSWNQVYGLPLRKQVITYFQVTSRDPAYPLFKEIFFQSSLQLFCPTFPILTLACHLALHSANTQFISALFWWLSIYQYIRLCQGVNIVER